ncbi:MAG: methionyl-tRNA formyltransferase [Bacteroidota bacterium]|nr:methionyl-tRNA formyltransferase [Bacteroidota bacterium]
MNVVLFGFTGLGNAVLRGLLKTDNVVVSSVFTKRYSNPYPYYTEIQIEDFCRKEKITCYSNADVNSENGINLIREVKPDLIVVASFNQIISKQVMNIPKLGIVNVHPSLLPKYRGPYPEQAALLNNEKETGVTVHFLSEKIDGGNILMQKGIKILADDNYSKLKKKLSDISEEIIPDVIRLFAGNTSPDGIEQNKSAATFFQKPKEEDSYLEKNSGIDLIKNKIRALNPFPGTSILVNDKRIFVDEYETINRNSKDGVYESELFIDVYKNSCGIRLFKKK